MRELTGAVAAHHARGRLPVEFPTISIAKSSRIPRACTCAPHGDGHGEMIRAQPMDAVVLIGGCDKTVPAS